MERISDFAAGTIEGIHDADKKFTVLLHTHGKFLEDVAFRFGLLPYEIYVIPGMYVAMLQMIWYGSVDAAQFHVVPHVIAFSIFRSLNSTVPRTRPGCLDPDPFTRKDSAEIEKGHCAGKTDKESFPSGHTGIAAALLSALVLQLYAGSATVFDVKIKSDWTKHTITGVACCVVLLVAAHRIMHKYHYFGDTLAGFVLGAIIGTLSWKIFDVCHSKAKKASEPLYDRNILPLPAKVVLSVPIIGLLIKFLLKDLKNLTKVHH